MYRKVTKMVQSSHIPHTPFQPLLPSYSMPLLTFIHTLFNFLSFYECPFCVPRSNSTFVSLCLHRLLLAGTIAQTLLVFDKDCFWWDLSDVFLMVRPELWVWGRKTPEVNFSLFHNSPFYWGFQHVPNAVLSPWQIGSSLRCLIILSITFSFYP